MKNTSFAGAPANYMTMMQLQERNRPNPVQPVPTYSLPFPPITGYEKIKADILQKKKAFSSYDRTYARNDILLELVEKLEADILELKRKQASAP